MGQSIANILKRLTLNVKVMILNIQLYCTFGCRGVKTNIKANLRWNLLTLAHELHILKINMNEKMSSQRWDRVREEESKRAINKLIPQSFSKSKCTEFYLNSKVKHNDLLLFTMLCQIIKSNEVEFMFWISNQSAQHSTLIHISK